MTNAPATLRTWLRSGFDRQALWLVLGFMSSGAWFNIVGYGNVLVLPDRTGGIPWERLVFLGSVLLAVGAAALFPRDFARLRRSLQIAVPTLAWAGTGMCVMAYQQSFAPAFPVAITGYCLVGIGHGWLAVSLPHALVESFTPRRAALLTVVGGLVAVCTPWALFGELPAIWQMLVAMALPLVACLAVAQAWTGEIPPAEEADVTPRVIRAQRMQVVAVAIGVVILRAASFGGLWGDTRTQTIVTTLLEPWEYLAAAVLFAALAAFTIIARSDRPVAVRHRVPLLVAIAGLLLVSVRPQGLEGTSALAIVLSVFEIYYQTLLSLIVITTASLTRGISLRVIALAQGLTYVVAIAWLLLFENSVTVYSSSILAVTYVLIIATALLPSGEGERRAGEGEPSAAASLASSADSRESRCAALAEQHALTPRETEVLCLLAEGRSLPFIQHELHLAEGTVRGHAYHIYQKLGVHDRQELIDRTSGRAGGVGR